MELVRKNKVTIIALISLIIMTGSVFFWNYISKKQASEKKEAPIIDVSDANNVPSVDAKLGSDIKITQSYLLNYTTKKSGIWYMSKAYVKDIKIQKKKLFLLLA